ncbi:MAG: YfiR family protein [Phenylobacterium sp.]|uniref:YfiR family protein n=1 Tax=Phenylobacterium sp. TaxID=1871053 RepID=UPI001B4DE4F7|nr:YfiR family protein [Phenylobacterium sp.]MBP7648739.1 YfiR family protein [Phenylobacterium sp.]MBP7815156.1 YfiR family protein [Phenylobacterium sp.]MBP9232285.1 YfiR family protein [Phenylobacterium sp.]MBP9756258.1 YfiR family protein [Phenylobacterium sp.]
MLWVLRMLGAAVLSVSTGAAACAAGSLEAPVKATYLYKLVPFVEWPAATFASPTQPVVLCLLGGDPFGAVLDQAVRGQKIGARAIVVHRLARAEKAAGCHVLYLPAPRAPAAAEALQSAHGAPVLTVTDQADGAGGIVNFVLRDNRVRFTINSRAAAENGLTISSKLLNLALDSRAGR